MMSIVLSRIFIVTNLVVGLVFWITIVLADPINFAAIDTSIEGHDEKLEFKMTISHALTFQTQDLTERLANLTNHFQDNFTIKTEDLTCPVVLTKLETIESSTLIEGEFLCPKPIRTIKQLRIESQVFKDDFKDINHFIKIRLADNETPILLTRREPFFPMSRFSDNEINFKTIFKQFVGLGIPHILFGFDHILFILAIHSIVRKFKDIVLVVTSFTIAHSLTLIMASLGWITITGRLVEPLIALSIAYTAIRNLLIQAQNNNEPNVLKERLASTFGFGLIHGLGFAGALATIKIPAEYYISALLSFNIGVEIGQLLVIAVFIPLLLLARRLNRLKEVVIILSGSIVLISGFWFIQRLQ